MNPSLNLLREHAPLAPLPGLPTIVAHQATDVFALWQAWEAECGQVCDVPYWAIPWPAALVLSAYLWANPSLVDGKSVLDCGCGGGVAAITALVSGARQSTGYDLDQDAIFVARENAAANGLTVNFACQDVTCGEHQGFDLILAADLFYQREVATALLATLTRARRQGSEVIIADSGRPFLPKENLHELACQSVPTCFEVEGRLSRTVRLYRLG